MGLNYDIMRQCAAAVGAHGYIVTGILERGNKQTRRRKQSDNADTYQMIYRRGLHPARDLPTLVVMGDIILGYNIRLGFTGMKGFLTNYVLVFVVWRVQAFDK